MLIKKSDPAYDKKQFNCLFSQKTRDQLAELQKKISKKTGKSVSQSVAVAYAINQVLEGMVSND